ncbi:MAG: OmpH family outer membrane protein [Flavobacteriaceae bacterium]|nr:OmpH family outer membrane protein [Flavobacteriaceae bacterium]
MKNLKTFLVAILLFVGATTITTAQSKVAHVNVKEIIEKMPALQQARLDLQKLEKTYSADIESSAKELQEKTLQYRNEAKSKTDEENERRALELQNLQNNIRQAQQSAYQELQKKQAELFKPHEEKIKAAIDKVSKSKGFNYVLDSSPGIGILLVANGTDLTAEIKKELGF